MILELVLFIALGAIAIVAALGMLFSTNAIYSALFLILNFAVIAVFYLILGAPFIAMVQITIYAGAIMVLFLFVIMLLGAEQLRQTEQRLRWQRPLAIILGLALLGLAVFVLLSQGIGTAPGVPPAADLFGSPGAIGDRLFNKYLLPFEVTSVLLLVAMIGAVVLTISGERKKKRRRSVRRENPPV